MTYKLTTNNEGLPLLIVNDNIMFAWDPNDLENYGVFIQKLEEKGIEVFAQLLADDPNTAFTIFCNT
jgi:hypothetical protein